MANMNGLLVKVTSVLGRPLFDPRSTVVAVSQAPDWYRGVVVDDTTNVAIGEVVVVVAATG